MKYPILTVQTLQKALVNYCHSYTGSQYLQELKKFDHLQLVFPELTACVGIDGGAGHNETIWEHLIESLQYAEQKRYSIPVQLAVLFHDIGKPPTKTVTNKNGNQIVTFYKHEVIGEKITRQVCNSLPLLTDEKDHICNLVRHHMYQIQEDTSDKMIRRWLFNLGPRWSDWFLVRKADRYGNRAKRHLPVFTQKMREFLQRINYIIDTTPILFKHHIALTPEEIQQLFSSQTELDNIYPAIVNLLNEKPERNTPEWLSEYIVRVYG